MLCTTEPSSYFTGYYNSLSPVYLPLYNAFWTHQTGILLKHKSDSNPPLLKTSSAYIFPSEYKPTSLQDPGRASVNWPSNDSMICSPTLRFTHVISALLVSLLGFECAMLLSKHTQFFFKSTMSLFIVSSSLQKLTNLTLTSKNTVKYGSFCNLVLEDKFLDSLWVFFGLLLLLILTLSYLFVFLNLILCWIVYWKIYLKESFDGSDDIVFLQKVFSLLLLGTRNSSKEGLL